MKLVEVLLMLPEVGPLKVYVVAVGARGVTELDADDAAEVPTLFVAVTVKVYEVPLVRPVMT